MPDPSAGAKASQPRHRRARLPYRRIAVLRANALGDLLFAWPALSALRAAAPEARIVLLGTALHREVFADRPGPVDRVEVLPPIPGVSAPPDARVDQAAVRRCVERLRAERFDLGLQLHGGGRYSNPFLRSLSPGTTVGMRTPEAEPLDLELPYVYYQHEVARYLEVLGLLGVPATECEPAFPVTGRDREAWGALELPLSDPVVAVHPGASDRRRRWAPERFAAVADAAAAAGASVVLTGTEPERAVVDAVRRAAAAPAVDTCGRLTIGQLAALYERCAVVVANDTGALHLAAAVGAATVGIFWCGNLVNGGPRTRLRHRPQVSWTLHCPTCGADCTRDLYPTRAGGPPCDHRVSFVDDVSIPEVVADVEDLLARHAGSAAGAPGWQEFAEGRSG